MGRIGLLTGTGPESLEQVLSAAGVSHEGIDHLEVETPWGAVPLCVVARGGDDLIVIDRHHGEPLPRPPHRIEHRAHLHALAAADPAAIVSIASVGVIAEDLTLERPLIVEDVLDLTGRVWTFHDEAIVHTSMTGRGRAALVDRLASLAILALGDIAAVDRSVTYAMMPGPQFETAADIRALGRLGADVVGMTMAPEARLTAELDLPHVGIALPANRAAGRDEQDSDAAIDHGEITRRSARLAAAALELVAALADDA